MCHYNNLLLLIAFIFNDYFPCMPIQPVLPTQNKGEGRKAEERARCLGLHCHLEARLQNWRITPERPVAPLKKGTFLQAPCWLTELKWCPQFTETKYIMKKSMAMGIFSEKLLALEREPLSVLAATGIREMLFSKQWFSAPRLHLICNVNWIDSKPFGSGLLQKSE